MTAEAIQPALDLGDYRGSKITKTKTKLANSSDGFDPSTSVDGEQHIYEIGEVLTVACRIMVTAHTPRMIDAESGELELLQTWKVGAMAVISGKVVAKDLDAVEKVHMAAKAAKAKKAAPKVKRSNIRNLTDGPKAVGESLQEALGQP